MLASGGDMFAAILAAMIDVHGSTIGVTVKLESI
jgi:hypothetical protein